ncbi:bifunctional demethylmenaquinone methyltransferase/2-methoxy-6-polyprenyl-1,4-benzoquinol methylase UbiE [bacterium]|nr:bifunctional demethylmenaquinone methyltransferase/2-methoxy-6-polyprenyl-1,4-benzoquinol methylase UbiE [bacterium]MBU1025551.1 bifunctional demethylmenaquinone methyltransferase/2-methoxy-6-polyprenyl-1,4-benzoquinol methylase UbiE [bacterium]
MTNDNFLDKALDRDEETIRTMFSQSADKYDFLNHLLSLNLDRGWRRTLANKSGYQNYGKNVRLLDLCTGTGDVAFEFLKRDDFSGTAVGIDFSSRMLQIAEKKAAEFSVADKVEFSEGNALDLKFDNESFDLVTIAFGLRNLSNLAIGLNEMYRVLKPGGKFLLLEFFKPDSSYSRLISNFYLRCIIPIIGRIVTGQRGAYDYLPVSRDKFISASEFDVKLKDVGFKNINHGFFLFRIAALHIAEKL